MKTEHAELFDRIRFRGQPQANPECVVVAGHARFTVLAPRLLRLEWSESGRFEDRASYAFPTRYGSAPRFTARREGSHLTLDTGPLLVRYVDDGRPFDSSNLSISFDLCGTSKVWLPGTSEPLNLRGTRRTLDGCLGDADLEPGLLSRSGWAVFDDRSVLFDDEGWVTPRPRHDHRDWYFFGYGHDYKAALSDYTRFGGSIPLVPGYALGTWWSRYWAYSAQELQDLVSQWQARDLPLDVLVVDMDWHTPHAWTGYTWNRDLFPDPAAFLRWVHGRGLRVTLNLHPAEGVQTFEEVYPHFARAMGVDPDSQQAIPFRVTDRRFVSNYFTLLHHPAEDEGVDFWWLDWQQGTRSEMGGLDPLPWLNHLHFADSRRRGRRPMLFSRWGGLGNHRTPIGFSGDTIVGWEALQFQPYLTATASNVLFGWWSHDIGGHMGGPTEPELYARWLQFGALSPCLRLHATKDPRAERLPWKYPDSTHQAAREALWFRHQIRPYLYAMARVASDSGISLCRPMYYEHPEEDAAYAARYQYFFGDQAIAAPIVHPADPEIGLAAADVWIPPGRWIDCQTKESFVGPAWSRLMGGIDRMPLLVRAGAILPMAPRTRQQPPLAPGGASKESRPGRLILSVFPDGEGHFTLYDDDQVTEAYLAGECERTQIANRVQRDRWEVQVSAVEGRCDALPHLRSCEIRLEGSRRPDKVSIDGEPALDWTYDPSALTTVIPVAPRDKSRPVTVLAAARGGMSALGDALNRHLAFADVRQILGGAVPTPASPREPGQDTPTTEELEALLDAVLSTEAPGRAWAVARLGGPLVRFVEFSAPAEAAKQLGRIIIGAPAREPRGYDLEADLTLWTEGHPTTHTAAFTGVTRPLILDTPFRFDGRVRSGYWTADLRINWRGHTLAFRHQSAALFPTIHTWQTLVYDPQAAPLPLEAVFSSPGEVELGLDWTTQAQTPDTITNLHEPHIVRLDREYREALRLGRPLACYLWTAVTTRRERDVAIEFIAPGPVQLTLNGQPLAVPTPGSQPGVPPLFQGPRRTAPVHLGAGVSSLLVASRPGEESGRPWFFGAAFRTAEPCGAGGQEIVDLSYA